MPPNSAPASVAAAVEVPKYQDFMLPTLRAIRDLGGSAAIEEIADKISAAMDLDLIPENWIVSSWSFSPYSPWLGGAKDDEGTPVLGRVIAAFKGDVRDAGRARRNPTLVTRPKRLFNC